MAAKKQAAPKKPANFYVGMTGFKDEAPYMLMDTVAPSEAEVMEKAAEFAEQEDVEYIAFVKLTHAVEVKKVATLTPLK